MPHLTTGFIKGIKGIKVRRNPAADIPPKVHKTFIEVDVDELNGAPAIARTKSFWKKQTTTYDFSESM